VGCCSGARCIWARRPADDHGRSGHAWRWWENNFAIAFEHRPNETSIEVPAIDLNYGIGDHIQLTLQTAPVLLKRSGHGVIGGMGETEAAVKWRFLDEATSGFDMSMFPRVIFNVGQSSVRRDLAEKTAHASKSHFKLRRRLAVCTWMLSSVPEQALLAEANGYMGLSAVLTLPNKRC
jgi:hypothetical protein